MMMLQHDVHHGAKCFDIALNTDFQLDDRILFVITKLIVGLWVVVVEFGWGWLVSYPVAVTLAFRRYRP